MLAENHFGWISTCQVTGQTLGTLLGGSVFIILESKYFSNSYIRSQFGLPAQSYGIVSLHGMHIIINIFNLIRFILFLIIDQNNCQKRYYVHMWHSLYFDSILFAIFQERK